MTTNVNIVAIWSNDKKSVTVSRDDWEKIIRIIEQRGIVNNIESPAFSEPTPSTAKEGGEE